MSTYIPPYTANPDLITEHVHYPVSGTHRNTIIILPEQFQNGENLCRALENQQLSSSKTIFDLFPHTRWVFPNPVKKALYSPHAQSRHLDDPNRLFTEEWFPFGVDGGENKASADQVDRMRDSIHGILRIIDNEVRVLQDPKKVLLAGIEQGMGLGLVTLMCTSHQLGGFMGINGWMPVAKVFEESISLYGIDGALRQFRRHFLPRPPQPAKPPTDIPNQSTVTCESSTDNLLPNSEMPNEVKQIPVFVSHARGNLFLVDTESSKRPCSVLEKIGFENVKWSLFDLEQDEHDKQNKQRVCNIGLKALPGQLEVMVDYFTQHGAE